MGDERDEHACTKSPFPSADYLARLSQTDPRRFLEILLAMDVARLTAFIHDWASWARDGQCEPDHDWSIWLVLAGRGFGKTRMGAEWVRKQARKPGTRIALVGASMAEVRAIMVEGESGLLACCPDIERPVFEPSLARLRWQNGSMAFLHSAAEPDGLRGPQFDAAWCDEIAKWGEGVAAWANLQFAVRLGKRPRIMATTTPRPVPLIRALVRRPDVTVTQGRTRDNRLHLSQTFLREIEATYGGTRLGRQELEGVLFEDIDGSLWTRALIERCRVQKSIPSPKAEGDRFTRIVIGLDPPATANKSSDACGIIVAGLGADDRCYVLEDASTQGQRPEIWASAVDDVFVRWNADRIVAETNQGGAMVESILQGAGRRLPVRNVRASIGKTARAEPVQAAYERGEVSHCGVFPDLEDEMCAMMLDGSYAGAGRSPDRADALVYALSELMKGRRTGPRVRAF